MSKKWITKLAKLLKEDQLSTGESVLLQHSKGESYSLSVLPDVVVFPESTEDIALIMKFAYENEIAVTPVAVNSSLEGHTTPLKKGISLDLMRMNRILEFSPEDLLISCEPAVTYPQINEYTRRSGLFFPIDPGAHASIGGMIATNASGTAAVRYGVTADYNLALELVTPSGEIINTGSKARKSSSGYNLNYLYAGSEGTLGIITKATIKLLALPIAASSARVSFKDIFSATQYVTQIIQSGIAVARCELVDAASIAAVNAYKQTSYPEENTIFLEFHGNLAGLEPDLILAKELAQDLGAGAFEASTDPKERSILWDARHSMYYAVVAQNAGKLNITTDVAVPISKLPEIVEASLNSFAEAKLNTYIVGHVGDGNFHLIVFYDQADIELENKIKEINKKMVLQALELAGTCTGEHGVGIRKLAYMEQEHGKSLEIMRAIKKTLDPKNIMNPGKKIPL